MGEFEMTLWWPHIPVARVAGDNVESSYHLILLIIIVKPDFYISKITSERPNQLL